jgi:hypothetical protein
MIWVLFVQAWVRLLASKRRRGQRFASAIRSAEPPAFVSPQSG